MRQNLPVHYSAADYDRYTTDAVSTYDDGIIRRLRQEYRLKGGGPKILLDIGTGTARLLIKIAAEPAALAEFNRLRVEQGIEQARMDEKYTAAEVRQFLNEAGLHRNGMVLAPSRGPGSLGMEVRISKAGWLRRTLVRVVGKLGVSPLRNSW